jgi:hypothetical protein
MTARNADSQHCSERESHHQNAHRCGQPGQQHGRRIPSSSSEHTLSTCSRLVSSFLTEMVQQIHSLRASGVMSSQAASTFASDAIAFRRSAGRLCTTPPEIRTVVIGLSRRLKDQAFDTRVQLGFRDYHGQSGHYTLAGRVTSGLAVMLPATREVVQNDPRKCLDEWFGDLVAN